MSAIIYYFSATGNSLAVAKKLQQQLDACELAPIASLMGKATRPNTDKVGFVFPLYYLGIPLLVRNFLEKINLDDVHYSFAVVTRGNPLAGGAIPQVDKILKRKNRRLDAGFYITMPENYIPMLNVPNEAAQQKQFQACERKIPQIAKVIKAKNSIKEGALWSIFNPIVHYPWATKVNNSDHRFVVEDSCISCGVCEQVCPAGNIKMGQARPEWLHHCQECLACLHHCPKQAIQSGKGTKGKPRYRHPEIMVAEITAQKLYSKK